MKSIQMKYENYTGKVVTKTFYVNNDGTGLFTNNGLTQQAGTSQFRARNPAELARKIRRWSNEYEHARMIRGSAYGW
jgi:hypothetical protein